MTITTHAVSAVDVAPLSREAAEELTERICAHAVRQARDSCELLSLIGEFDAGNGWAWSNGFKSVAHWLAWTCSMTQGTAREHIRVARALRRMPTITQAFGAGELSYSKVREATRIVDLVDEAKLYTMARYATASQLARMISSFRAAAGTRIKAEARRRFRLITRDDDPMTGVTGHLPAEEAAIQRARDLNSTPPTTEINRNDPDDHDATPPYTDADALLDVCQHYVATAVTEDESGEDRSLVIIEIAAEQLGADEHNVPAGIHPTPRTELVEVPSHAGPDPSTGSGHGIDTGRAPSLRSEVCTVRGAGGIEPHTAQRLICTGSVLGTVIDQHGDVLAMGRTRRLVSKRQRRALHLRDQLCQYPGCWRDRHLQAHHRVPWSQGGATDLANLILLCRFHHVVVHEGGMRIVRRDNTVSPVPGLGIRAGSSCYRTGNPPPKPAGAS